MKFETLRNKTKWVALLSGVVLFIADWRFRGYWRINEQGYGETTTPAGVIPIWLLLLTVTLVCGVISFPRWQSVVALGSLLWVLFMTMQGHWP